MHEFATKPEPALRHHHLYKQGRYVARISREMTPVILHKKLGCFPKVRSFVSHKSMAHKSGSVLFIRIDGRREACSWSRRRDLLSVVTKFAERGSASKSVRMRVLHSFMPNNSQRRCNVLCSASMGYAEYGTFTTQTYGRFTFYGLLRQSFSATADVRCCTPYSAIYGKPYRRTVLSASHLRLKVLAGSFHYFGILRYRRRALLRSATVPHMDSRL